MLIRRSIGVGGGVRGAHQRRRQPDPVHVHDAQVPPSAGAGLQPAPAQQSAEERQSHRPPLRALDQRPQELFGGPSAAEAPTLRARRHRNESNHQLTEGG